MALRSLTIVLLVVTIIPDIIVMANMIAKPRQMIVNVVYDFVEDGNATHPENPTIAPTATSPGTTVTAPPATATMGTVTPPVVSNTTNNGEFQCTGEGVFADPKDCSSYYRCNKDLVPIHQNCIFGHFDPTSKGCLFGGC